MSGRRGGLLPRAASPHESRDARIKSFDIPGASLVTGGLVTLVYAITQANNNGWGSATTIALLAAAAVLLTAFVVWERRVADPLVPPSFFQLRTVVGANVAGLVLGTAIFAMFLMLTLYMQQVLALLRDADGGCVPRRRRDRDLLVRSGGESRQPHRRQVRAHDRDDGAFGRARVLHTGIRRRLVRRRPPARVPAGSASGSASRSCRSRSRRSPAFRRPRPGSRPG